MTKESLIESSELCNSMKSVENRFRVLCGAGRRFVCVLVSWFQHLPSPPPPNARTPYTHITRLLSFVSSPPVRISNMFIKAFVNFSGSISSVSIATQISFRSLWGLRATTDDASEFRFECNESSTHTVDCEYLSGKLSRFHDKSKFQESSGGKCKSDGRLNWRKTTSPHRLTQKEQQRKTALFTRRPFYVWRFNGTFGAASQAHRSCDGIGPAAHTDNTHTCWRLDANAVRPYFSSREMINSVCRLMY